MGCGIGINRGKKQDINNLPPWKCQNLFVFAKDNNKNTIMKFDASNEEWQILPLSNEIGVYDHSCGVMIDDDLILVTGGKKEENNLKERKMNESKIKDLNEKEDDDERTDGETKCFLFSVKLNQFFKFPKLNLARYWHMMVAFKNCAYVLGGGTTNENSEQFMPTSSVEKISLLEIREKINEMAQIKKYNSEFRTQWSEVEPFTKPRYKGNAFVYNDNIFLIGGISKENRTCRYIEKYHSGNNQWSFLKWKLPFALHSSSLTALSHTELLLIGGRNDAGLVSSIYQIDILKGRYKSRRGFSLREYPKILHFDENIYIFGGDKEKTCERFNPIEFVSLSSNESYTSLLDSDLIKFPSAPPSVTIGNASPDDPDFEEKFEKNINLLDKSSTNEKFYLLGTPSLPFMLEFDGAYESVTYLTTSINFRFYYFGVSKKINHLYLISVGGVTPPFKKASKSTQIINLVDYSAKKGQKMLEGRIKFDAVVVENNVYVCGGQSYQNQKEKYLKTTEAYDIINDIWKPLAPMNLSKYNHSVYAYKNNIYTIGGSDGENILNIIEEYSISNNTWTILDLHTHEPLILFSISSTKNKEEIIIIGGNNGKMNLNIVATINFQKMNLTVLGGIKEPRCQHKVITYQDDLIIFGGIGSDNLPFEVIKANNLNYKTEIYNNLEKSVKKYYSDKSLLGIPIC